MNKSILKSKTFWFGVMTALLPLWPEAKAIIVANPDLYGWLWGAATVVLRKITEGKVVLLDD